MQTAGKILKFLILIGIIALVLTPFYMWVSATTSPEVSVDATDEEVKPQASTTYADIAPVVLLTLLYAVPTALVVAFIHTLLAFGLAYGLARGNFPLREELRLICFLALFIPATLVINPLFKFSSDIGMQGNFTALFLAVWALPWLTALFYLYLVRLPKQMELYAAADGLSTRQIFMDLIVPYSYKGLISVLLLSFLINYHSLYAAAAALPSESFSGGPTPYFSYLPTMISIFRQPVDIISPSTKLLVALIFQIPSLVVLPMLIAFGIPMLRTILTGRFSLRQRKSVPGKV